MDADRDHFLTHGYCVLRGLYEPDAANAVLDRVHLVFRHAMENAGFAFELENNTRLSTQSLIGFFRAYPDLYIACMGGVQNLVANYELSVSDRLTRAVTSLGLTLPAFSTKPIFMMNNPHTSRSTAYWKMPAHQDWRSIQGSLNGVIVWTALADVTRATGPLEIIPGSHAWGLLRSQRDEWYREITDPRVTDAAFVPVSAGQGDAIVFSAFLVHRSGINDGSAFRYSMQFRYNDLLEPSFVERALPTTYGSDVPRHDFVDEDNLVEGAAVLAAFDTGEGHTT